MSVPVISLNSSPPRCLFEPGPDDPKVSLPGFDLARSMNSLTVLAGTLLLTTITASVENDTATGAKSRIRSYGLVVVQDLEVDVGRGHDQDRVAVRRGLGGLGGADDAGRARPVLDEERLLEFLAELLGDVAADQVGGTAGAERHDHLDRVVGPLRCRLGQGGGRGQGGNRDGGLDQEFAHAGISSAFGRFLPHVERHEDIQYPVIVRPRQPKYDARIASLARPCPFDFR